jgi:hypothetical protein
MGSEPLDGQALALGVAELVEGGAGFCGELCPAVDTWLVVAHLEEPVSNCDLVPGPIDVTLAEAGGLTVVAVEVGFELEGVVAPDGPSCRGSGGRPEPGDEVFGRVVDEPGDSVRTGPVEGVVELGDGLFGLGAPARDAGDVFLPGPLMFGQAREAFPQLTFGGAYFFRSLLSFGQPSGGLGDGVVVLSSPPPLTGVIGASPTVGEGLIGLMASTDKVGQLHPSLFPFLSAVVGDAGVDSLAFGVEGGAGVAELVDAVGEGVVGGHAGDDDRRPVPVDLAADPVDVVAPPALGLLEPLTGILGGLQQPDPSGDGVVFVAGGRRPLPVEAEPLLEPALLFPARPAQPGQRSPTLKRSRALRDVSLHGGQVPLGRLELGPASGQLLLDVGRGSGEDVFVLGNPFP